MHRRRFIAGLAAAVGVAGCVGGQPDGPGASPSPTPEEPPASFEVTASRCGTQTDRAAVTVEGGTVAVDGTTWGNDACYAGRLEAVDWDGETLAVRVTAERRAGAAACAQCITEIDYRATVELPRRPAEVVVVHRGERVTSVRP